MDFLFPNDYDDNHDMFEDEICSSDDEIFSSDDDNVSIRNVVIIDQNHEDNFILDDNISDVIQNQGKTFNFILIITIICKTHFNWLLT